MDGAATTQISAGGRALQIMVQGHIVFVSVLMTVTFAGGILLWLRSRKKLQQYTVLKWIQRKIYIWRHRMRGRSSVMEAYELQALEEAQNTQPEAAVAVLNSESDEDTDVENFLVEVHKPFTSCPPGALFLPADSRSGDSERSSRNEGPERDSRGLDRGRRRRTDAPIQKSSDIDTNDCDENMTSPTFNTHPKGARRKSPQKLNLVKDTSAEKSVSSWTPCSSLLAGVKTRADKNAYSSQPETSDSDNDYYSEVSGQLVGRRLE
ncbi:uncharacterized protein LOC112567570 [Pomacea canaliculata]|uniref:uncharacterized protein LOC112567570 n=1 Tax=Pomacea canaliculata TaxID=400727 RepID=UPI000D73A34C|nr:uncharacterized protein LOC112567570 [Pomacea canaliculata]